jgi:enoyl-CoA hydratase/carnithine racemase
MQYLKDNDIDSDAILAFSTDNGVHLTRRRSNQQDCAWGRPSGLSAWVDVLVRLARAPVVSVASMRGRARGAGSEFVLACDLRFASRENTLLGQWEVGVGVVPGGGPMARLSRMVVRGRALEI